MTVTIEAFRPVVRNTLRGFCRCRFESGLVMDEIAIHVGNDDGRAWCSPPARPMIDATGTVMRDDRGKVRYAGLITFATATIRNNWSDQILRALAAKHPDALTVTDRAA